MSKETKYEIGGTCRYEGNAYYIAGTQWEIHQGHWLHLGHQDPLKHPPMAERCLKVHASLVEDYNPPKPPKLEPVVYEWLTAKAFPLGTVARLETNKVLTKKYGAPPTVRTYNGEEPREFGLTLESDVLCWCGYESEMCWEAVVFACLAEGDKWMKQPAAPKEDV